MRVLVTGGSGLLGRKTIAALAARGHEVVALQRRESPELACRQVVVVVEHEGRAGLARPDRDRTVRDAVAPQAVAAVLTVPKLPVDRRHNSKIDRTRLGLWAEALLAGGRAPRRP